MTATIELLEVETGDIRHIPAGDATREHLEFIYSEGSHSCDCNRETEWHRAYGLTNPFEAEPCTTGRYLVRITCDGNVILDEHPTTSHPHQPKETMTDSNKHIGSELEAEIERATEMEAEQAVADMDALIAQSPSEPVTEDIPLLVGELHMLLSRMNLAIAKLPRGKLKADSMRHVSTCMDWAEYLDKDFSPPRILPEDQDSE